jgi:hypothetical protein
MRPASATRPLEAARAQRAWLHELHASGRGALSAVARPSRPATASSVVRPQSVRDRRGKSRALPRGPTKALVDCTLRSCVGLTLASDKGWFVNRLREIALAHVAEAASSWHNSLSHVDERVLEAVERAAKGGDHGTGALPSKEAYQEATKDWPPQLVIASREFRHDTWPSIQRGIELHRESAEQRRTRALHSVVHCLDALSRLLPASVEASACLSVLADSVVTVCAEAPEAPPSTSQEPSTPPSTSQEPSTPPSTSQEPSTPPSTSQEPVAPSQESESKGGDTAETGIISKLGVYAKAVAASVMISTEGRHRHHASSTDAPPTTAKLRAPPTPPKRAKSPRRPEKHTEAEEPEPDEDDPRAAWRAHKRANQLVIDRSIRPGSAASWALPAAGIGEAEVWTRVEQLRQLDEGGELPHTKGTPFWRRDTDTSQARLTRSASLANALALSLPGPVGGALRRLKLELVALEARSTSVLSEMERKLQLADVKLARATGMEGRQSWGAEDSEVVFRSVDGVAQAVRALERGSRDRDSALQAASKTLLALNDVAHRFARHREEQVETGTDMDSGLLTLMEAEERRRQRVLLGLKPKPVLPRLRVARWFWVYASPPSLVGVCGRRKITATPDPQELAATLHEATSLVQDALLLHTTDVIPQCDQEGKIRPSWDSALVQASMRRSGGFRKTTTRAEARRVVQACMLTLHRARPTIVHPIVRVSLRFLAMAIPCVCGGRSRPNGVCACGSSMPCHEYLPLIATRMLLALRTGSSLACACFGAAKAGGKGLDSSLRSARSVSPRRRMDSEKKPILVSDARSRLVELLPGSSLGWTVVSEEALAPRARRRSVTTTTEAKAFFPATGTLPEPKRAALRALGGSCKADVDGLDVDEVVDSDSGSEDAADETGSISLTSTSGSFRSSLQIVRERPASSDSRSRRPAHSLAVQSSKRPGIATLTIAEGATERPSPAASPGPWGGTTPHSVGMPQPSPSRPPSSRSPSTAEQRRDRANAAGKEDTAVVPPTPVTMSALKKSRTFVARAAASLDGEARLRSVAEAVSDVKGVSRAVLSNAASDVPSEPPQDLTSSSKVSDKSSPKKQVRRKPAEEEAEAVRLAATGQEEGLAEGPATLRGVKNEWCLLPIALAVAWKEVWCLSSELPHQDLPIKGVQRLLSKASKAATSDKLEDAIAFASDPSFWPGDFHRLYECIVAGTNVVGYRSERGVDPPLVTAPHGPSSKTLATVITFERPMESAEARCVSAALAAVMLCKERGMPNSASVSRAAQGFFSAQPTIRVPNSPSKLASPSSFVSPSEFAPFLQSTDVGLPPGCAKLACEWIARRMADEGAGGGSLSGALNEKLPCDDLARALMGATSLPMQSDRSHANTGGWPCVEVWSVVDLTLQAHEQRCSSIEAEWALSFARADRRTRRCGALSWEEFHDELWPRIFDESDMRFDVKSGNSSRDMAYSLFSLSLRFGHSKAGGDAPPPAQVLPFGSSRAKALIRMVALLGRLRRPDPTEDSPVASTPKPEAPSPSSSSGPSAKVVTENQLREDLARDAKKRAAGRKDVRDDAAAGSDEDDDDDDVSLASDEEVSTEPRVVSFPLAMCVRALHHPLVQRRPSGKCSWPLAHSISARHRTGSQWSTVWLL